MLPMLMSRVAPMSLPSEQTVHGAGKGKVKENHSLGEERGTDFDLLCLGDCFDRWGTGRDTHGPCRK